MENKARARVLKRNYPLEPTASCSGSCTKTCSRSIRNGSMPTATALPATITSVEWSSFGKVADPGVWSQIHDEGVQVLENIANIRVPVIAAIEGRAHIHSDYALLANVIVAAEGATFQDVGHYAAGVAPGDGIFTTWSYRAGAGRAEAFLLNPQPLPARTAQEWGVVAEVVPNGKALGRAQELAELYLKAPEVTRRNTRVHFIQPLKERIVREVGYGLSLEGSSSADLVKSMRGTAAERTSTTS